LFPAYEDTPETQESIVYKGRYLCRSTNHLLLNQTLLLSVTQSPLSY